MALVEADDTILDFVSGVRVKATPEEVEAVQIFSRILVNDFGYPGSHLQTRPQWRVRVRPSDTKKEYPIDIAVFEGPNHQEENIKIIVECKKPSRRDGRSQLESYLRFSEARIGVWFNGEEKLFLKKTEKGGAVLFEEIPNIPRFGERIEDVGMYRRKDLRPTHNLKSVFKTIRNHLAANAVGVTRDEVFAQQIINLILGDGRGGVFCENSLESVENWKHATQNEVHMGNFDVVLTNPPFGKQLKITDRSILKKYRLGHKWKKEKGSSTFEATDTLHDGQSPQVLFIERCLALLRPGGRMGIMIPESMFCNPGHRHIIHYIRSVARIVSVVSFPEELFQPFTHAKACGVIIEKTPTDPFRPHGIFMAEAKWCGHDSRGLPVPRDDIPEINKKFDIYRLGRNITYDHFGFVVSEGDITDDIYLPKYYNPEIQSRLQALNNTHNLLSFGALMDEGVLVVKAGHEVGKLA